MAVTYPSFKTRAYASPKPSHDASPTAAHNAWHLRALVLVTTLRPTRVPHSVAARAPSLGGREPVDGVDEGGRARRYLCDDSQKDTLQVRKRLVWCLKSCTSRGAEVDGWTVGLCRRL
jgi:hypothetical protein